MILLIFLFFNFLTNLFEISPVTKFFRRPPGLNKRFFETCFDFLNVFLPYATITSSQIICFLMSRHFINRKPSIYEIKKNRDVLTFRINV